MKEGFLIFLGLFLLDAIFSVILAPFHPRHDRRHSGFLIGAVIGFLLGNRRR